MKSAHKLMKAKKRRKDYEKKRNVIRANSKRVKRDEKTKEVRWAKPRVSFPAKRKNRATKKES